MGSGGGGKSDGGGTNWQDVELQRAKDEKELHNWQQSQWDEQARQAKHTNEWNKGIAEGETGFRDRAAASLWNRGLDPANYSGLIDQTLGSIKGKINLADENPASHFDDSEFQSALGRQRDEKRTSYTTAVNNRFQPGFEDKYFGSESDDPFINDVLGRQKQDAMQYVKRAQDRGQLDSTGYGAAMNRIGEMEQTGRATAQKLGDAVLQTNRSKLTDVANNARSAAGSFELGQQFDPGFYNTRFNETLGAAQNSLEGDVRGALEGQKFFDVGDLISKGGAAQGTVNPKMESLDALAARDKLRNAPRGIGGGGTF